MLITTYVARRAKHGCFKPGPGRWRNFLGKGVWCVVGGGIEVNAAGLRVLVDCEIVACVSCLACTLFLRTMSLRACPCVCSRDCVLCELILVHYFLFITKQMRRDCTYSLTTISWLVACALLAPCLCRVPLTCVRSP